MKTAMLQTIGCSFKISFCKKFFIRNHVFGCSHAICLCLPPVEEISHTCHTMCDDGTKHVRTLFFAGFLLLFQSGSAIVRIKWTTTAGVFISFNWAPSL